MSTLGERDAGQEFYDEAEKAGFTEDQIEFMWSFMKCDIRNLLQRVRHLENTQNDVS